MVTPINFFVISPILPICSLISCIVSYKGVTKPGHVDNDYFVNTGVDLLPTICDYAGVDVPDKCFGRSFRAAAEGQTVGDRPDHAVSEAFVHWEFWAQLGEGVDTRAYSDKKYRYVCHNTLPQFGDDALREQLFDREKDPGKRPGSS